MATYYFNSHEKESTEKDKWGNPKTIKLPLIPSDTQLLTVNQADNFALALQAFIKEGENNFEGTISQNKLKDSYKIPYVTTDCQERHTKVFSLLFPQNRLEKTLTTSWRFVIGLGNESVYDTGITLHHVYGIPYIPGSAVKGIIRSAIIQELFLEEAKIRHQKDSSKKVSQWADILAMQHPLFTYIFGADVETFTEKEAWKGHVVFGDAFPVESVTVKQDIMNPHYAPYYGDNKPPADYHKPIPINFLTVVNTAFHFLMGWNEDVKLGEVFTHHPYFNGENKDKNYTLPKSENPYLCPKEDKDFDAIHADSSIKVWLERWLTKALREYGMGAKTAVGYGRFS